MVDVKNMKVEDFIGKLEAKGILVGIPLKWFHKDLESAVLINFAELHKKKDIDTLIRAIGELPCAVLPRGIEVLEELLLGLFHGVYFAIHRRKQRRHGQ